MLISKSHIEVLHLTSNYVGSGLSDVQSFSCDTTTAPISIVISVEDIANVTTDTFRTFTVFDKSGLAETNNITLTLANGGTINGQSSAVIDLNYGTLVLYSDGTNMLAEVSSSGGGGGIVAPVDITYSALKGLRDGSSLVAGQPYRITDFRTINKDWSFDIINTADIEPLVMTAVSSNVLNKSVQSDLFPHELVIYDIDYAEESDLVYGDYEYDGVEWTIYDGPAISDVTTNSYVIDIAYSSIVVNDEFLIDIEDNVESDSFDEFSVGTDVLITDDGTGKAKFTFPNTLVDFTDTYVWIYMEYYGATFSPMGRIQFRRNHERDIETMFDFRGVKQGRTKPNLTAIDAWSDATAYIKGNIVKYGTSVWKCMTPITGVGTYPTLTSDYWIVVLENTDTVYNMPSNQLLYLGIQNDTSDIQMLPVFGAISTVDDTVSFSLEQYEKIYVYSENNIFNFYDNKYCYGVSILGTATLNTISGDVRNMTLTATSNGNIFSPLGRVNDVEFLSRVNQNTIKNIDGSRINAMQQNQIAEIVGSTINTMNSSSMRSATRMKVLGSINSLNISTSSNLTIGEMNYGYMKNILDTEFGYDCEEVYIHSTFCRNNKFGNLLAQLLIEDTVVDFADNVFENYVGISGTPLVISHDWKSNRVGAGSFSVAPVSVFNGSMTFCTFGVNVDSITLGQTFNCSFGNLCTGIEIQGAFTTKNNTFKSMLDTMVIPDTATHVFADYDCEIFNAKTSTGVSPILTYYNADILALNTTLPTD